MNSSTLREVGSLALIPADKARRFLADLANLRNDPSAAEPFRRRWEPLFGAEVPIHAVHHWAVWGEEEGVAQLSVEEELWNYWLLPLRNHVRHIWLGDARSKQWGIFGILERFFLIGARGPEPGPWSNDSEWFRPRTLAPATTCERIFSHLNERTAVCKNSECPAPHFFAARTGQKYCAEDCALPAQREFKRKWWTRNGPAWRATRAASAKRKRNKFNQKTRTAGRRFDKNGA